MPKTLIIGDGPAGLSAALFLAKNGQDAAVFAQDKTPMHAARLLNYLGIEDMTGSDFQQTARKQATDHGAALHESAIESLEKTGEGFKALDTAGAAHEGAYLLIAIGAKTKLAGDLGLALDDHQMIPTDRDGHTAIENCYAAGWSTRPDKVQAIISAGDGAAAALDILSKEAGKPVHDFDTTD